MTASNIWFSVKTKHIIEKLTRVGLVANYKIQESKLNMLQIKYAIIEYN